MRLIRCCIDTNAGTDVKCLRNMRVRHRLMTHPLDVLFSFFLEELLEEVHLLLILNRPQMQSFLHNHHRWFTFLVGSPERKAIPVWIASLGKVDPVV